MFLIFKGRQSELLVFILPDRSFSELFEFCRPSVITIIVISGGKTTLKFRIKRCLDFKHSIGTLDSGITPSMSARTSLLFLIVERPFYSLLAFNTSGDCDGASPSLFGWLISVLEGSSIITCDTLLSVCQSNQSMGSRLESAFPHDLD